MSTGLEMKSEAPEILDLMLSTMPSLPVSMTMDISLRLETRLSWLQSS